MHVRYKTEIKTAFRLCSPTQNVDTAMTFGVSQVEMFDESESRVSLSFTWRISLPSTTDDKVLTF